MCVCVKVLWLCLRFNTDNHGAQRPYRLYKDFVSKPRHEYICYINTSLKGPITPILFFIGSQVYPVHAEMDISNVW